MKIYLDKKIDHLKTVLGEMFTVVKQALHDSFIAFNRLNVQVASEILSNDKNVNQLQMKIDRLCLKIFALQQPLAFDLRFVISTSKVNGFLERIGDFSCTIASEVLKMKQENKLDMEIGLDLKELFSMAMDMFEGSINAFLMLDLDLSHKIICQDSDMDVLYRDSIQNIMHRAHETPKHFELAVSLINVAKSLERIADYATNIAEQSLYVQDHPIPTKYSLLLKKN